jgi:F-type H+-transporting ATPase subunit delta
MPAEDRINGYAAAFLEFARAEGELERVGDELFRIARTFEGSNELRDALTDPRLGSERKKGIIDDLLGDRSSPLTVNLINFVVAAGRASDLPAIADRLAEQAAAARNKAIAEVRSPFELDRKTMEKLAKALSEATGKDVEVKTIVDPSLIGGITARIGDLVVDGSVRHRLDELRETLTR